MDGNSIERSEFELVFQPEVGVDSLRVELVESLLRWRQPDGRLAAAWHRGVWPQVRVAINVCSRQLLDLSFVDRLKDLRSLHRLPVQCLEMELTETVLQTCKPASPSSNSASICNS